MALARQFLTFLALAGWVACNSADAPVQDECGANMPCPDGFTCSDTSPRRCVSTTQMSQFKLVLDASGQGTVTAEGEAPCTQTSCTYLIDQGSTVSLTAAAAQGWKFVAWSGDCAGTTPTTSVTVVADESCSATFTQVTEFAVTVSADAGGTVSTAPTLSCSGMTCSGMVESGQSLTLTATPSAGYRFDRWSGDAACDGQTATSLSIQVTGDVTCRASFVRGFSISASSSTPGAVVLVSAGSCTDTTCIVDEGAAVTLTASSVEGARFTGWSGDEPCTGTQPTLTFTVTASASCVAGYASRVTVTGAVGGGLPGSVTATSPDAHSTCSGSTCTADAGAPVTLVAPTVPGYRLVSWTGDGCDAGTMSGSGLTLTAGGDTTCTATYVEGVSVSGTVVGAVATITATSASAGASCTPGSCSIDVGGSVMLTAPDLQPSYRFLGWSGDPGCAGTSLSLTLSDVQSSIACTATYVRRLQASGTVQQGLSGTVIAATSDPEGLCKGDSCTVDAGSAVELTAPDIDGYRFTSWSGAGCRGTDPILSVTPTDADIHCVANYVQRFTVSATVAGADGTVAFSSTAASASCNASGCTVDAGDDVGLNAPDLAPDYRFIGWSGDDGCTGATRAIVISGVGADVTCTATYVRRYTVTVEVQEGVTGTPTITTADPAGDCVDLSCTVDEGQEVTLTAPTVPGMRFTGWAGDGPCNAATDNPLTFAAGETLTCTASYVQQVTVTAVASGAQAAVTVSWGTCSASSCLVDKGASVTLSAPAVTNYRFTGWSGDSPCVGTDPMLSFNATSTTTCTANYVRRWTIAGQVQNGLSGSVTATSSDPASVCSGNSCVADNGKTVTLVAPTIQGYRLTGWSDCTGTPSGSGLVVTATADLTCTANYALGVSVSGTIVGAEGTVTATSTSPGAVCGMGTCTIDQGGSVTLASEDLTPGYRFVGWGGDTGCTGTTLSITLSDVQSSVSCTATWVQRFTVTGAMPAGLSGTVTAASMDPNKVCSGSHCTVDSGQSVTLTAPTVSGHRFTGWSGVGCGTGNPMSVTPSQDVTCTAVYATTVSVSASASGGSPTLTATSTSPGASCSGASCSLDSGGDVTLQSSDLSPDYRFKGWDGDAGCAASSLLFTVTNVTANKTCVANWVQRFTVTGSAPSGTVTASSTDPNKSCTTSSCTVDAGQSVMLAAPDINGYRFTGWSPSTCGTTQTTTVTPTATVTCAAQYVQRYTISALAGTGGTVSASYGMTTCSNASCTVDAGTTVTLTATPNNSYRFDRWSGTNCTPTTNNPLMLKDVNATCTASFIKQYTISATAGANGSVTAKVGQTTCPNNSCTVDAGTTVTLTASGNSNPLYRFDHWSGTNCTPTTNNPLSLTDVDASCTAAFVRQYTIAAVAGTHGSVTAKVGTSTCSNNTCVVDPNVTVTLTATADSGYHFNGWTGTGCTPTGSSSLSLSNVDATCTASFAVNPTYTATGTVSPAGTGSVTTTAGAGVCSGNTCTGLPDGTVVTFTAAAGAGYVFSSWSNGCSGTSNPTTATITGANVTCTANFVPQQWTITVSASPAAGGSVSISGGGCSGGTSCTVNTGTSVTISASQNKDWRFRRWSGNCAGTSASQDVTVTSNMTCVAEFYGLWAVTVGASSTDIALTALPLGDGTIAVNGWGTTDQSAAGLLSRLGEDTGELRAGWTLKDTAAGYVADSVSIGSAQQATLFYDSAQVLHPALAVLDKDEAIVWQRHYLPDPKMLSTLTPVRLIRTSDGGYLFVSTGAVAAAAAALNVTVATKVGRTGGPAWSTVLCASNGQTCFNTSASAVIQSGTSYVVVSNQDMGSTDFVPRYYTVVTTLDSNGNVTKMARFSDGKRNNQAYDVAPGVNGEIVITGAVEENGGSESGMCSNYKCQILVAGIDPVKLGWLWGVNIGAANVNEYGTRIIRTGSTYALVGYQTQLDTKNGIDVWFANLARNGSIIDQTGFGGTGTDVPYSVASVGAGGFVVTGLTSSAGAGGIDTWTLRLDDHGRLDSFSTGATIYKTTYSPAALDMSPGAAAPLSGSTSLTSGTNALTVSRFAWTFNRQAP